MVKDKQLALFEAMGNSDYYTPYYDVFICLINDHDKFYHWVKDKYSMSDFEYESLLDGGVVTAKGCELFIDEVEVI